MVIHYHSIAGSHKTAARQTKVLRALCPNQSQRVKAGTTRAAFFLRQNAPAIDQNRNDSETNSGKSLLVRRPNCSTPHFASATHHFQSLIWLRLWRTAGEAPPNPSVSLPPECVVSQGSDA